MTPATLARLRARTLSLYVKAHAGRKRRLELSWNTIRSVLEWSGVGPSGFEPIRVLLLEAGYEIEVSTARVKLSRDKIAAEPTTTRNGEEPKPSNAQKAAKRLKRPKSRRPDPSPTREGVSSNLRNMARQNAKLVYTHWFETVTAVGKRPSRNMSDERRRLIERQLKSYTVDQLKDAISGLVLNPWNMGLVQPRDGRPPKKYLDIEHAISTAKRIETALEHLERNEPLPDKPRAAKSVYEIALSSTTESTHNTTQRPQTHATRRRMRRDTQD